MAQLSERGMAGFRKIIVHQYGDIDAAIVGAAVQRSSVLAVVGIVWLSPARYPAH